MSGSPMTAATSEGELVSPAGAQDEKAQVPGPRADMHIEEMMSVARLLHLPIHSKVLNSLTCDF